MNKYLKNSLVKPPKRTGAKLKGTVAAIASLCIVCTVFFASLLASGCNEKEDSSKIEEGVFLENLNNAPVAFVSKETLPDWLISKIGIFESFGESSISTALQVFRGIWNGKATYFLKFVSNCPFCDVYYENGERIEWNNGIEVDKFVSQSKDWKLIYQVGNQNFSSKSVLSDIAKLSVVDKFEFPDISHINDWNSVDIMPRRFKALQLPDGVLANISTAGLLETCLEFPYLLVLFYSNDFQRGFEDGLLATFNGFRELMKRQDLVNALIEKYNDLRFGVKNVKILTLEEQGKFSFRHFVLEMIIAQDVVIKNMSEEQERTLFLLAIEHSEIKRNNPDIFGGFHTASTALLYAKKVTNDNQVRADMKQPLADFLRAPSFVDQATMKYLNDYINNKFK